MGKMKFHIYGQPGLVDLPDSTTVEDLRSLASFNRVIKNYLMMERIENKDRKTKEDIMDSPEFKAAHIAFQNGCGRGYEIQAMAHYMFLEGIKYERTKQMPKLDF